MPACLSYLSSATQANVVCPRFLSPLFAKFFASRRFSLLWFSLLHPDLK